MYIFRGNHNYIINVLICQRFYKHLANLNFRLMPTLVNSDFRKGSKIILNLHFHSDILLIKPAIIMMLSYFNTGKAKCVFPFYWKGRIFFWFLAQKQAILAHYPIDKTS